MGGGSSKKNRDNPLFAQGEELPETMRQKRRIRSKAKLSTRVNQGLNPGLNNVDAVSNFSGSMKSLRSNASLISHQSWYTDHSSIQNVEYENYEYPFENIVFEGGGSKGIAYAGAVAELERIGVMKNMRRFAGASAGSMNAAMLCIGYSAEEVSQFLCLDFRPYFLDAGCGICSLLPNLVRHFGWHPAQRYFQWFGDRLEEKTGNRDITFEQIYKLYGRELCIIVTNLNQMDVEYCHVKTTPNMPIRLAVRMSMAIPGIFCAVQYRRYGRISHYVDGGMICNYPIHCFDGWYLSLKPEDSFLRRLQPLEDLAMLWDKNERFGAKNDKTLGMLLYSTDEQELMVSRFSANTSTEDPPDRPKTKLSRKRKQLRNMKERAKREHALVTKSLSAFLRVLADNQLDQKASINLAELKQTFESSNDFLDEHAEILFGDQYTVEDVFEYLDCNEDGEIDFNELMAFAEQKGIGLHTQFIGYQECEINKVADFLRALQDTLLISVKRVFTEEEDIHRTIGIDTLYIQTADFDLELEDKMFLIQQGARGARSFLKRYVRNNNPPLKPEFSPDVDIADKNATNGGVEQQNGGVGQEKSATNASPPPLSTQTIEVKSAARTDYNTVQLPPIPLQINNDPAKSDTNRVPRGSKRGSVDGTVT